MKKNFNDFLEEYPMYKNVADTPQLRFLFDNILNTDENIIKMYHQITLNRPAIIAVADEIEDYYDSLTEHDFIVEAPEDDEELVKRAKFTKRAIGAMIGTIMKNLGYITKGQKDLPITCRRKYFFSGSTYQYVGNETMRVVQSIEHL